MSRTVWIIAALVIGVMAGAFLPRDVERVQAQAPQNVKWENKLFVVVTVGQGEQLNKDLANINAGGWEYAGFATRADANAVYMLFKRPKR